MQRFRLAPETSKPVLSVLFSYWDRWMMVLARRYAKNQVISQNKSIYGSRMFNSIIVYSSLEKARINKMMPKGKEMNHAEVLKWSVFIYNPSPTRKKNT